MRAHGCRTLGPGRRSVIWVQGCHFHCEGCIAKSFQSEEGGTAVSIEDMVKWVLQDEKSDGLTISGGEPFLQAAALAEMIRRIHETRDLGVIIYTGFLLEELELDPGKKDLLQETDLLIDGRYVQAADTGRPYVGSDNQRMHFLTERYRPYEEAYYLRSGKREVEFRLDREKTMMIGVPASEHINIWERIKEKTEKTKR